MSGASQLDMVLNDLMAAGAGINALRRAVPATAAFRQTFATWLAAKGESDLALRELELAFILEPDEKNALTHLRLICASKAFAAALVKAEDYLRRFPQSFLLLEQKAVILERLDRKAEAMFIYQTLQDRWRQAGRAAAARWCLNAARLQAEAGHLPEAVAVLRQGIKRYPGEAELHFRLGLHLRSLGREDDSLAALQQAALLAPDNAAFRHQLGEAYQRAGLDGSALKEWVSCLEKQPDFTPCRTAVAGLEQKFGLPEMLLRYELGPSAEFVDQEAAVKYFLQVAEQYARLNRPADAAAALRWGIGKYQEARLHHALGLLLRQTGEGQEALAAFRQAVFLDYGNAEYRRQLGEQCWRAGLRQQAAEEWRICLTIQPDHTECREALGRAR